MKIYKQQNEQPKIYCSKCLHGNIKFKLFFKNNLKKLTQIIIPKIEYHAECENINSDEVKEKSKSKFGYTCSICKDSG